MTRERKERLPSSLALTVAERVSPRHGTAAVDEQCRERAILARVPDTGGFAADTNQMLKPFIDVLRTLLREQAVHGLWGNEPAKQTRSDLPGSIAMINRTCTHSFRWATGVARRQDALIDPDWCPSIPGGTHEVGQCEDTFTQFLPGYSSRTR